MSKDVKAVSYATMDDGRIKTKFSDGTEILMPRGGLGFNGLSTDSGQISAFRPAVYIKPQKPLNLIQRMVQAAINKPEPSQTSEQGAASASSPVTFYLSLWQQRFGRRARIEDCRALYLSDTRVWRSVNTYVDTALEGGAKISCPGQDRKSKKAQEIAKKIEKLFPETLLQEWGKGLIVEGDLFVQHIVTEENGIKKVVGCKAVPSNITERLCDDADNFVNSDRAFEQIDSMTFESIASWNEALMTHVRWSKINGDRYGSSELTTARRSIRAIELMEQAVTINRMVRAPLRRLHSVGTEENTGSLQEVYNYKAENGFATGKQEAYNPSTTMVDYFGNGNTSIQTLAGDPNIGQVDDLKYLQNVFMASLPTPGPFFGLDIERVSRDVLADMMRIWLRSFRKLHNSMNEVIKQAYELALIFEGIEPDTIEYSILWKIPSLESPSEVVERLTMSKECGGISQETLVSQMAQLYDTADISEEMEKIKKEGNEIHKQEVEKRSSGTTLKDKLKDEKIGDKGSEKPVNMRKDVASSKLK